MLVTCMAHSLDPAFEGGDRCVLRFGKQGKEDGKEILKT